MLRRSATLCCKCCLGVLIALLVILGCLRVHFLVTRRYLKYHLDRIPEHPELRAFVDHFPLIFQPFYDWEPFYAPNRRLLPGGLINRFDWYLVPAQARFPGHRRGGDPGTVFALPEALDELLTAAKGLDARRGDRVLVIGASEMPLSEAFGCEAIQRQAKVRLLRRWFKKIFYYVKDVDIEGIKTMPLGLTHLALSHKRHTAAAQRAIAAARTDAAAKPKAVMAAWTMPLHMQFQRAHDFAKHYGPAEQDKDDHGWSKRFEQMNVPAPDRLLCELGWDDRMEAHDWAQTPAAIDAGVELRSTKHLEYLGALSQYRFTMCPLGSGIQSIKMFEALLVFTVPIVRRVGPVSVYDDLISYGFPILVVGNWSDITTQRLSEYWESVAPSLPRIRHRCLTVDGFWRIFTGANYSCL